MPSASTNPFDSPTASDEEIDQSANIFAGERRTSGGRQSFNSTSLREGGGVTGSSSRRDISHDPSANSSTVNYLRTGGGGGSDFNNASGINVGPPIESSWHFLGDLPYRRIPLYEGIKWNVERVSEIKNGRSVRQGGRSVPDGTFNSADERGERGNVPSDADGVSEGGRLVSGGGLAAYPQLYLSAAECLVDVDLPELLSSTTSTHVAGCPHGGPVAVVTVPKHYNINLNSTLLRIMTTSGRLLASINFPPKSLLMANDNDNDDPRKQPRYSATDILTIGFTNRMTLLVILRDSTCLTYNVNGRMIIPPFATIPSSSTGGGRSGRAGGNVAELLQAAVYDGGVAVLSTNMQCALVEILDEHDDPAYVDAANIAARKIVGGSIDESGGEAFSPGDVFGGARGSPPPPHFALVTPLPTDAHSHMYGYTYCTLAVLSRISTSSGRPEVFLSTSDNSVIIVDTSTTEIIDADCRPRMSSPIISMSFAPNGRFLACFTQSAILTVISTSFETKVLDFDTSEGSPSPPKEMKWCGEDSVVLHWKNLGVLMVGPYGDWLRFPYEETDNLHIVPEIDCCRVITDTSCEVLQRVPADTANLLRIGSIEPSAMLLDASDAFEAGSPSSDEAARAITRTGLLNEAIESCIEAATREFDLVMQKRLLAAASYGMHFSFKEDGENGNGPVLGNNGKENLSRTSNAEGNIDEDTATNSPSSNHIRPTQSAHQFVAAARKLRMLNALRHPSVGLTLTSLQYEEITPTGMIARLVAMKRSALATSLASYLRLDKSVQAYAKASRAADFVSTDKGGNDVQTADAAIEMLNQDTGGGDDTTGSVNRGAFAAVALSAYRAGRPGVASILLSLEASSMNKVPALITTRAYADAAAVATASRDIDLIFMSIMEFERACLASSADVNKGKTKYVGTVVSKFPKEACDLAKMYYTAIGDAKAINQMLFVEQNFHEAGTAGAKRGLEAPPGRERSAQMKEASRVLSLGKDSAFQKSCTDDYIELVAEQERLRASFESEDVSPPTSSVTGTIESLVSFAAVAPRLSNKLFMEADKLGRKFRVPDKRLWYIKVRALSTTGQWGNLQILANSRTKSPIGYKPFALAAIREKQPVTDIMRYVERVTEPEDRYYLFCEAKLWQRALEEAMQLKDLSRLMYIRSVCGNPEMEQMCDQLAAQLE